MARSNSIKQRNEKAFRVLVAGSLKAEANPHKLKQFKAACRSLGKMLAERQVVMVLGSEDGDCADLSIAEGADVMDWRVVLVQPIETDPNDLDEYARFSRMEVIDRRMISGNWLNPEIRRLQLREADVVILISGGFGTHCLAKVGCEDGVPTIPIGAFGGSACEQFEACVKTLQPYGIAFGDCAELQQEFNLSCIAALLDEIRPQELRMERPSNTAGAEEGETMPRAMANTKMPFPNSPRSVFISYAHADNENADPKKRWLDRFITFLKPFVRQEDFVVASDRDILIGDDWHQRLQSQLAGAEAAVLLVSPDFLASDYIAQIEVPVLLKGAADAGLKIYPIIISPCSYQRTKIKYLDPKTGPNEFTLSSIQAANPPSKTLVEMDEGELNRTLQKVAEQLADLLNPSVDPARREIVAGNISPPFGVVGADAQPVPIRPLLRELERALTGGNLQDSELGPDVLATLKVERELKLATPFDSRWIIAAIQAADNYFALIRRSAGQRDWQRDFAKTATPILVGVAWSFERSPDAQAVVMRLCSVVAKRLRLQFIWPNDPDELNDLKNGIYRACLDAGELECDDVLAVLQGLTVIGPE